MLAFGGFAVPTRNVILTEHLDRFVERGIDSGRFCDASEVVRAGLRLLEQKEAEERAKAEWLRDTTADAFAAFDRGEGIALSSADVDGLVQGVLNDLRSSRDAARG